MPVTQEFIESLMKQNQMQLEQIEKLNQTIAELNATIKELREQLNKNSGNSSKPPSSDGFKKAPKSLREKSGKKRGGQKGHQGTHLAVLSKPDEIKRYIVLPARIGISALQRLALRKHVTSLTR